MRKETFELAADLSEVIGGRKIISATVGPRGEACLLLVEEKFEAMAFGRVEQKGFASFPLSRAERGYPATFLRFRDGVLQETDLAAVEIAYPTAQALPNDEILLVGARCDYRKGDPEKNGTVFGGDGMVARRFVLGDGINDVQTDRKGLIWVAYFDEGVFGNYGWSRPIGAPGLVCFDENGKVFWEFKAPAGAGMIADCYAMNQAGDSVWACYYTDFPVVRIDGGRKVRAWKNTVAAGANAMAVNGQRVILWGGYGDKRMRCVELECGEDEMRLVEELSMSFPDEVEGKGLQVIGRGSTFHAFAGARWYRWTMGGSRG